jgi:Ca2+-binding RTX toxin-like protein
MSHNQRGSARHRHLRRRSNGRCANLEPLERRALLSVSSDSTGVVRIYGTEGDDFILVRRSQSDFEAIEIRVNGKLHRQFNNISWMRPLRIETLGGNDTISLQDKWGPVAAETRIYAGDGNDTVFGGTGYDRIDCGGGDDSVNAGDGKDTIYGNAGDDSLRGGGSADLIYGNDGADTLRGDAGNDKIHGGANPDRIRGSAGHDDLTGGGSRDHIAGEAGVDLLSGEAGNDACYGGADYDFFTEPDGAMDVEEEWAIYDATTGPSSTKVNFTTGGGAKLDLIDNKLVTYFDPVGDWSGASYQGVTGLIDSGRGNASNVQWDGRGIVTTDTRAINNSDLVSIQLARVGSHNGSTDGATTTFAGQTVLGSDTVTMVTWGGDANLDGKINIDDYGGIDFNVGSSGSVFGWFNGDFNYDGKINIDDYGVTDLNVTHPE